MQLIANFRIKTSLKLKSFDDLSAHVSLKLEIETGKVQVTEFFLFVDHCVSAGCWFPAGEKNTSCSNITGERNKL